MQTERQITKNGDVFEIDEGVISDSENVMVTNVTIHVVGSDDDRSILRRFELFYETHQQFIMNFISQGQL